MNTSTVLEHRGPGPHPSGSPQRVHGIAGGEKKFVAAKRLAARLKAGKITGAKAKEVRKALARFAAELGYKSGFDGNGEGQKTHGRTKAIRSKEGEFTLPDGRPLPKHISKIPPAWTEVEISEDPKADLLVKGRDAKGRVQSVYSDSHRAKRAAIKFARVAELRAKSQQVKGEILADLATKHREEAATLLLIQDTGLRPGSTRDTKAAKQAYGATTLEGRHVIIEKEQVRLRFVGKKGKDLDIAVTSLAVREILVRRKKAAGATGKLFDTDHGDLLGYAKTKDGGGFKTKDFRTARGTAIAVNRIKAMEPPTTKREYKQRVKEVATAVSQQLGNTPVIALQSYIDPNVFSSWRPIDAS